MIDASLKSFLDKKVAEFDQIRFIKDDPICIPHHFNNKQDIEIAGFFAAIFAWGNRTTIIRKGLELMAMMGNRPYHFCVHHTESDLENLPPFSHRTFNTTDLLYFIAFFNFHYSNNESLESAFTRHGETIEDMLNGFHQYFFSLPHVPKRTVKHIARPERNSTCKRLNMFLRWMVRKDKNGVDFGIWEKISPAKLICPIDIHVARVAEKLRLITGKQKGWKAAKELTLNLCLLDPHDPVKYDFALFGLGIIDKF